MKRIIALILVLCSLLCACKKKKENAPASTPTKATVATAPSAPKPTEASTPKPTEATKPTTPPEPVKPVIRYRHPLNGTPLEEPWSGQATAVVVNNIKASLPQSGISMADIFYEVEVESSITRCLAIFTDFSKVGTIGSVRSARTYFNSLAVSYDAPLIHAGGSNMALAGRYGATGETIDNWQHMDIDGKADYSFRDMDRYGSGVAWEHCLFTTGGMAQKALEAKKYDTPEESDFGLTFGDDVKLNGAAANEVTVKFKGGKTTTMLYDAATKQYKMSQHGADHIDGNTGEPVTFKNVIVIYTTQTRHSNGIHQYYESLGTGKGYAAINGQIVPITWTREELRDSYTYTLEDGSPLTLETGKTYIAMVGIKHDIAYK